MHSVSSGSTVADHLLIGGPAPSDRNVISGNLSAGIISTSSSIQDDAQDTREIENNYIGVAADGVTPLGNDSPGIHIDGPLAYRIHDNVIANNTGAGIALVGGPAADGRSFEVSRNSIYANGLIAIDLDNDGPTANDADDSDAGVNGQQNYPVLVTAQEMTAGTVQVTGALHSLPNQGYTIELFTASNASAVGKEARAFLATATVTTDGSGVATFTTNVALTTAPYIVATATEATHGLTSEVSHGLGVTRLPRYQISGTITRDGASPLAGVIVTLTGADNAVTATNANGHYAFTNLPGPGPYVVTPSLSGRRFEPRALRPSTDT